MIFLFFFLLQIVSFCNCAQLVFDNFSFGTAITSPDNRVSTRTLGLAAWRGTGTVANLGAPISVLPNVTAFPSSTGLAGTVALAANWSTPTLAATLNAHNATLFISVYFLVAPNVATWRVGVGLGNRPVNSNGGPLTPAPLDSDAFAYHARLVGTATLIRYQTFSNNGSAATTLSNLNMPGTHAVNAARIMPMFVVLRATPNTRSVGNDYALAVALASNTLTPPARIANAPANFLASGNVTFARAAQNPLGILLYGLNVTIAQVRIGTTFADIFAAAPPPPITTSTATATLPTLSTTRPETSGGPSDSSAATTTAPTTTTKTIVINGDTPAGNGNLNSSDPNNSNALVSNNAPVTSSSGDETGVIIGVVVGILALVAAAAVVFVVYKKSQSAKQNESIDSVSFDRPKYGKIPPRPSQPDVGTYGPAGELSVGEYSSAAPPGVAGVSSYGGIQMNGNLFRDASSERIGGSLGAGVPVPSSGGSDSQYGDLSLGDEYHQPHRPSFH